jgi:type II secretory pathway component PulK
MVKRRSERGSALLLALAVVGLAALAVGTALGGLQQELAAARRADTRARLRALADAGLAATLARLAADRHATGLPPQRFAGGEVASDVVPAGRDAVDVVVNVTTQDRSLTVAARVRLERTGPTVLWWRGGGAGSPSHWDERGGAGSAARAAGH